MSDFTQGERRVALNFINFGSGRSLYRKPVMKKLLLVLIDGLGDVAIPQLDYQTPLQAAKTPWLDKLAGNIFYDPFVSDRLFFSHTICSGWS